MAATRAATVTLPGDHVVGLDGPRAGLRRVDDGNRVSHVRCIPRGLQRFRVEYSGPLRLADLIRRELVCVSAKRGCNSVCMNTTCYRRTRDEVIGRDVRCHQRIRNCSCKQSWGSVTKEKLWCISGFEVCVLDAVIVHASCFTHLYGHVVSSGRWWRLRLSFRFSVRNSSYTRGAHVLLQY